jgi:hypothetical protein
MVIAPASTGSESSNKIAVIRTDQTNSEVESIDKEEFRIFKIVVIKLMAPKIDEAPARWSEKIVKSIDEPL